MGVDFSLIILIYFLSPRFYTVPSLQRLCQSNWSDPTKPPAITSWLLSQLFVYDHLIVMLTSTLPFTSTKYCSWLRSVWSRCSQHSHHSHGFHQLVRQSLRAFQLHLTADLNKIVKTVEQVDEMQNLWPLNPKNYTNEEPGDQFETKASG